MAYIRKIDASFYYDFFICSCTSDSSGTQGYWLNPLQNMCAVKGVQPTLTLWPCSSRPLHNHYNYSSISEFIKGLKKTKSNGERMISEYVRYSFPRTQRESTQEFSPFLRGLLGRYLHPNLILSPDC